MTVDVPPTTPRDDDDLEAALRALFARRAEDVTPRLGSEPAAAPPVAVPSVGHRARRRRPPHRTLFAALATAATAAVVVGAVTLLPTADDGGDADVATAPDEAPGVVWPLGDRPMRRDVLRRPGRSRRRLPARRARVAAPEAGRARRQPRGDDRPTCRSTSTA